MIANLKSFLVIFLAALIVNFWAFPETKPERQPIKVKADWMHN